MISNPDPLLTPVQQNSSSLLSYDLSTIAITIICFSATAFAGSLYYSLTKQSEIKEKILKLEEKFQIQEDLVTKKIKDQIKTENAEQDIPNILLDQKEINELKSIIKEMAMRSEKLSSDSNELFKNIIKVKNSTEKSISDFKDAEESNNVFGDNCCELIGAFSTRYLEMFDSKIEFFNTALIEAANYACQNDVVLTSFILMKHFSTIAGNDSSFVTNPNFDIIINRAETGNLLKLFSLDKNFFNSRSVETSFNIENFNHMNAINNSSRLSSLEQYNKNNKNNRFSKNEWGKVRIILKKFIENNTNMHESYSDRTRAPLSTIFQKK
jgi:hypothetical protein